MRPKAAAAAAGGGGGGPERRAKSVDQMKRVNIRTNNADMDGDGDRSMQASSSNNNNAERASSLPRSPNDVQMPPGRTVHPANIKSRV